MNEIIALGWICIVLLICVGVYALLNALMTVVVDYIKSLIKWNISRMRFDYEFYHKDDED